VELPTSTDSQNLKTACYPLLIKAGNVSYNRFQTLLYGERYDCIEKLGSHVLNRITFSPCSIFDMVLCDHEQRLDYLVTYNF